MTVIHQAAYPPPHAAQLGGGNSKASAPSFSCDLWDLAARFRESSGPLNKAINAMGESDARECISALINFRCDLLRQITMCQQLEAKLQFSLQDDWEGCKEVYR